VLQFILTLSPEFSHSLGSERVDGCSQRNTRSLLLAVLYQNFKLGQYQSLENDCFSR